MRLDSYLGARFARIRCKTCSPVSDARLAKLVNGGWYSYVRVGMHVVYRAIASCSPVYRACYLFTCE